MNSPQENNNVNKNDIGELALSRCIGSTKTQYDQVDQRIAYALAASLNCDPSLVFKNEELPKLWHWTYFTEAIPPSKLGEDGHPLQGGFLPIVDLPNRMWAGSQLSFHQPLHLGEQIERKSEIIGCEKKQGSSGKLVFVKIQHKINGEQGLALEELQTIVYREPITQTNHSKVQSELVSADYRKTIKPDALLLFRYSALTFNSHRIHYDKEYATRQEGYPSLVVHGPLIATLLLNNFSQQYPTYGISNLSFQAVAPLYENAEFDLCGRITQKGKAELWAECQGILAMKIQLEFSINT